MYCYRRIAAGAALTAVGAAITIAGVHTWTEAWIGSGATLASMAVLHTLGGVFMLRRVKSGKDPFTGEPCERIQRKVEPHEPDQYADQTGKASVAETPDQDPRPGQGADE